MSAANINNAVSKISRGADVREEMALTMGPMANWQEFLVVAPMCVGLLGELISISTKADFSLAKKPPKDGFQLLRWPNSFRASLLQVRLNKSQPPVTAGGRRATGGWVLKRTLSTDLVGIQVPRNISPPCVACVMRYRRCHPMHAKWQVFIYNKRKGLVYRYTWMNHCTILW